MCKDYLPRIKDGSALLAQEEFSYLIGRVYECAIDPGRWNKTLHEIQDKLHYAMGGIDLIDFDTGQYLISEVTYIEPQHALVRLDYNDDVHELFESSAQFYYSWPMDKPFTGLRHNWFEAFSENRYLQLVKSWGIIDMAHMILLRNANRFATLTFGRHEKHGPISKNDYQTLKLLIPHLRRAVTISDLLNVQRLQLHALKSTMDCLELAIVLVDENLRILYTNRSAATALSRGELIQSRFGKLAARDNAAHMLLQRSVFAESRDAADATAIGIPLPGVHTDSVAFVLPLEQVETIHGVSPETRAAVFVTTQDNRKIMPVKVVGALYRLTPAEVKVLEQIASGKTVAEAADALCLSLATVRTHLKRLFEKTDTCRQSELIALLAKFTVPVAPGALA